MKKNILFTMTACGLFILSGCNNQAVKPPSSVQKREQAVSVQTMHLSYRGIIPCADCEGIEVSLFLENDGTWVMNQRYLGKARYELFTSYGIWTRMVNGVVLTNDKRQKHYFRPRGDDLEMLDIYGERIDTLFYQHHYILRAVKAELPTTPMTMQGLFRIRDNAAIFQDCVTGHIFTVKNTTELIQAYTAIKNSSHDPVMLIMRAHFASALSQDDGWVQKMLVIDQIKRFHKDAVCPI